MAVDNGIAVRKILLILIVCKQAARLIIGAVIQVVQVILVIVCLRYRIVNGRIREGKPADDVRPGFPERIKIHCGEEHRSVLPGRFRFRVIVLRRFGLLRQLYMGSNVLIGSGAL